MSQERGGVPGTPALPPTPPPSDLAVVEVDLDTELRFARCDLVLTEQCLQVRGVGNRGPEKSYPLTPEHTLRLTVRGVVGTLELLTADGRVAQWRFTAAVVPQARKLVQAWETRCQQRPPVSAGVCPSCGTALSAGDDDCATCKAAARPASAVSLVRLLEFARPRAGMIVVAFTLTLASTAAGLVPPYLTMPLLDKVLIPHQNGQPVDPRLVYMYLAGLAGAAVAAWMLDWARLFVSAWASERISADLRVKAYSHLQSLSVEFFGGKRTGDLMSRISSDTDRLCNFLSAHLVDFLTDLIMIAMTSCVMVWIDPYLTLATLCPFPVIVLLVNRARGRLLSGYRQGGVAWAAMCSVLADTIPGIRVVKAFAQEQREVARFRASNDRVLQANDRVNWTWAFFGPVVTLLTTAGVLAVWGFAAWRVYNSFLTVGVLTAFLAYIARFYARSESMIRIFSNTQRAAASAQRIFEILDRSSSVPEPKQPVHPEQLQGRIDLDNVRFSYGTREVLHGINLRVEPGEVIGLVGASGAGKTTLINLICRFYDVAAGSIRVDGVDIRSYPVEEYRRNIGLVLQEPFLFFGTVAENIAYGRPDVSRDVIIAAARAARAHDFILRLPDGYDSLVGERGQTLSGGERQRISIARALLIDPRVLILDEATSSVDTETERDIQEALATLIRGRTTIAIAHRLSTLRRADRIVVLDKGTVVEVGSHEELLSHGGLYARLVRAQQEMTTGGSA